MKIIKVLTAQSLMLTVSVAMKVMSWAAVTSAEEKRRIYQKRHNV